MSKKTLLYFTTALSLIIFSGCTIAPKADYTRTHIDRPYNLPKDVAQTQFGARYVNIAEDLVDPSAKSTSQDEFDDGALLASLYFENGITENFSWIYPLGAKYTFFKDNRHSFGVTAFTFFAYSSFSADYWFRLNKKTSLRSSFNGTVALYSIFAEQKFRGPKLEVVHQFTKHFASSFGVSIEKATFESRFFNIFFGTDKIVARYAGGTVKATTTYSLTDRWDLISRLQYSKYKPKENSKYDLEIASAMLGANYYW